MEKEIKTLNSEDIMYVWAWNPKHMADQLTQSSVNDYEPMLADWAYDTVNNNLKYLTFQLSQ